MRHDATSPLTFDSRGGIRGRWYMRVLVLGLNKALTYCIGGTMPSQEPQTFYKSLLAGCNVAPGRPSEEYKALLNVKDRGGEAKVLPLIEDPDPDPPPVVG